MVNTEYADAYTEVLEILKHIPKSDYEKIPNNVIEVFTTNNNKGYNFIYDSNKTLSEQNVSKKAKTIIAILFRDYWATPSQREKIIEKEKYDMVKLEIEKKDMYNPDKLFNKSSKLKKEDFTVQNNSIIKYKKENFFKNLLSKIMNFLHIPKE